MTVSGAAVPTRVRLVDAMRQLPGGVSVITTGRAPNRTGYTGTAVFSLSVDPERVVISVGKASSSYAAVRESRIFGLNVLRSDQQAIADRFAGRGGVKGEERYDGAEWTVAPSGVSLLKSALASVECAVEEIVERHSHAIVIGEVISVSADSSSDALFFWRSRYGSTNAAARLAAE